MIVLELCDECLSEQDPAQRLPKARSDNYGMLPVDVTLGQ